MAGHSDFTLTGIGLAVAFELAMHVFVHYTVPGANFAASLAEAISPALDSVGLTTLFSQSAAAGAAGATAGAAALPALDALAATP